MAEYGICEFDTLDNGCIANVEVEVRITPEQAALGALDEETVRNLGRLGGKLKDGEVAAILLRRHDSETDPGGVPYFDRCRIQDARKLGLWPPEVKGSE